MAKTLVNFLVEPELLQRFDAVAGILGRTRTSLLVGFMETYCLEQVVEIEKRNQRLDELSAALKKQRKLLEHSCYHARPATSPDDTDDLPGMMVSDIWENVDGF